MVVANEEMVTLVVVILKKRLCLDHPRSLADAMTDAMQGRIWDYLDRIQDKILWSPRGVDL